MLCPQYYCNIPNDVFADNEHYTEQWVKQHYSDCMENFDLNMRFFDSLDEKNFTKHLDSFVKKNKLREVFDLKDIAGIEGIYVLVLGQYKQAYIGKSSDIKRRILVHWSRKKATAVVSLYILAIGALVSLGFGPLDFVKILGLGLLDFFDFLSNSVLMPIVALLTCICIGYFVKPQVICDEVELNKPFKEKKFYIAMLKYVAPICLILILIFAVSEAMGWIKV